MHMIGKDDTGVDRKGARAHTRRTASRNISICVTNTSERRSSRFTVKKQGSTRNPIAAIVRHFGSMLDLWVRRNALCFSALRLLIYPAMVVLAAGRDAA